MIEVIVSAIAKLGKVFRVTLLMEVRGLLELEEGNKLVFFTVEASLDASASERLRENKTVYIPNI